MSCIVTDNPEKLMTEDIRDTLIGIESNIYEDHFPFEEETLFCYLQGGYEDCQSFIDNQSEEIRDYLVIKQI